MGKKDKKRVDLDTRPIPPLRKNLDYGHESPYFGTPGGGEKSMGDWIKKHRKERKKKLKELQAYDHVVRAASIYLIKTAAPEDVLNTIPAKEEVKEFILQQPKEHIGPYIGALKKNPAVGIEELQKSVKLPKEKQLSEADKFDQKIVQYNIPQIKEWSLINLRKLRRNDPNYIANFDYRDDATKAKYPEYDKFAKFLAGDEPLPAIAYDTVYIGEFTDWVNNTEPDLASLTFNQINDEVVQWHQEQASQGAGLKYEGPDNIVYGPQWKNPDWNGWTIRKVTSENDLLVEGNKMNHCVGSYCESVNNGQSTIYSLRDPSNEPHVTMEANGASYDFEQIQGKSNSDPSSKYKHMIREWFETIGTKNVHLMDYDNGENTRISLSKPEDVSSLLEKAFIEPNEYGLRPSNNFYFKTVYNDIMRSFIGDGQDAKSFIRGGSGLKYHAYMDKSAYIIADLSISNDRTLINYLNNIQKEDIEQNPDDVINNFIQQSNIIKLLYQCEESRNILQYEEAEDVLRNTFNDVMEKELYDILAKEPLPNYEWLKQVPQLAQFIK